MKSWELWCSAHSLCELYIESYASVCILLIGHWATPDHKVWYCLGVSCKNDTSLFPLGWSLGPRFLSLPLAPSPPYHTSQCGLALAPLWLLMLILRHGDRSSRGASLSTCISKSGASLPARQRETAPWEGLDTLLLLLKCRRLRARTGERLLKAGKGKRNILPLEAPERNTALLIPWDCSPGRPLLDSDIRNCKIINL